MGAVYIPILAIIQQPYSIFRRLLIKQIAYQEHLILEVDYSARSEVCCVS